jgi:Protein of unknown function (DUF4239)
MNIFLDSFSAPSLFLLMIVLFVIVGQIILFIVQKYIIVRVALNERLLATPAIACVIGIFTVVLAFLAISVWQSHGNIKVTVGKESNAIYSIFRTLDAYPPALREVAKDKLTIYVQEVVDREWSMMKPGETDYAALQKLKSFHDSVIHFVPTNNGELVAHQELMTHFSTYRELRRDRLMSVGPLVGNTMWLVLSLGTLIMMIFLSCLQTPSYLNLATLLSFFSAMVSLVFSLLILDNYPFMGPEAIGSGTFQQLLKIYFPLP